MPVTYESLSDPEFMRIASHAIPLLDNLHDEFDAAKDREMKTQFSPRATKIRSADQMTKLRIAF